MTRRWMVVVGGLFLTTSFAAAAWGADEVEGRSVADRMADFRRRLTHAFWEEDASSQPPPRYRLTAAEADSSRPTSRRSQSNAGGFPQIDASSMLPSGLFGRPGSKNAANSSSRSAESAQPPSASSRSARSTREPNIGSTNPRVGSVKSSGSSSKGFEIPGLDLSHPAGSHDTASRSSRRSRSELTDASSTPASVREGIRLSPSQSHLEQQTPEELERELVGLKSAPLSQRQEPELAARSGPTPADEDLSPIDSIRSRRSPSIARGGSRADRTLRAAAEAFQPEAAGRDLERLGSSPRIASRPLAAAREDNQRSMPRASAPRVEGSQVLVANQTPAITSHVLGPKQILIGHEAVYELHLQNQGKTAAEELVAEIRVPSSADVLNSTCSQGIIRSAAGGSAPGAMEWHIRQLEPGADETLELRLIPRTGRPLELGISWSCAPVGSRAIVEVQEPKLKMHVSGPDEVLFGKPQIYRLTLSNPGSGVAEDVKIDLLPPGGGAGTVTSHPLGNLPPGASRSVEVELTAREAGKLFVKASATAAGGLSSESSKEIFCRKPELEVDWRGPDSTYAGTEATYFFRVRNPGTAPAEGVAVRVHLPEGAELISASDGQTYDAQRGEVVWDVGPLQPGDDRYMELNCSVNKAGMNELRLAAATSDGELTASKLAQTNVIALADLKLYVSDPKGPIPVGEEAIYEIRVENRGANSAENVDVVALFSEGIEPVAVEGAQYSASDGRVTFRTIGSLEEGRSVVFRIRAKAVDAGTHVFRAEVLCSDLDIKLAAEETTRFFEDTSHGGAGDSYPQTADKREQFETSFR